MAQATTVELQVQVRAVAIEIRGRGNDPSSPEVRTRDVEFEVRN